MDIGFFDSASGYMFGISYHINSPNSIATYWSNNGCGLRMFASDMRDIWPYYFVKYKNKLQIPRQTEYMRHEFKDVPFKTFYKTTTGFDKLY